MKKIFQKYQSYIPSKKIQKILLIIPGIVLVFGIFRGIQYLITPDIQKNIIVSLVDELDMQDPFWH
jgi:hypothetical protein